MPKSLPSVDANGNATHVEIDDYPGGEHHARSRDGTSVLHRQSHKDALTVCGISRGRVLLGYSIQTRRDRSNDAFGNAATYSVLALAAVPMLSVAARTFWLESRATEKVWELTEWLDLDGRSWRSKRIYPAQGNRELRYGVPFSSLAIVCYLRDYEWVTHVVGVCEIGQLQQTEGREPSMVESAAFVQRAVGIRDLCPHDRKGLGNQLLAPSSGDYAV